MVLKLEIELFDMITIYNEQENVNKNANYFIPYLLNLLKKKGHNFSHIIPLVLANTPRKEKK